MRFVLVPQFGCVKSCQTKIFSYVVGMTLGKYLIIHNISSREFAGKLRVSIGAVRKWRQNQRMPRKPTVNKIASATKGQVKYEDWY